LLRHTLILAFKFKQAVRSEKNDAERSYPRGTGLPRSEQYPIINILLDLAASPEMQSFHRKDLYRIGDICRKTNPAD